MLWQVSSDGSRCGHINPPLRGDLTTRSTGRAAGVSGTRGLAWFVRRPQMSRIQLTFGALIVAQAAHSLEEYFGHLWESFLPARVVAGLVSSNLGRGFGALNLLLLAFGAWCFFWPVRRGWPVAVTLAWLWTVLEISNGIVHPLWSLHEGGYTPGLATAPALLALAVYLAYQLRRANAPSTAA